MNDHIPDVTKVIEEAARLREVAISRRREIRAVSRNQLNEARQYGLRARHASRLREASTSKEIPVKISDKTIHETIEAADIVNLIAADVLYTRHTNTDDAADWWEGVCPFCKAEPSTLRVHGIEHSMAKYTGGNVGRQVFDCSACGVNGNAITYVQLRDKCTFAEAVVTLGGKA